MSNVSRTLPRKSVPKQQKTETEANPYAFSVKRISNTVKAQNGKTMSIVLFPPGGGPRAGRSGQKPKITASGNSTTVRLAFANRPTVKRSEQQNGASSASTEHIDTVDIVAGTHSTPVPDDENRIRARELSQHSKQNVISKVG